MKFILSIFVSCSILFFNGCSSEKKKSNEDQIKLKNEINESKSDVKTKEESKTTNITLQDTNGKIIPITPIEKGYKFEGFENKVVLVVFFTTWCPPCKAEIPHLINLQEKYKEKFAIISVLLEENKSNEEINSFMKYNKINFAVTNSADNFKFAQNIGGVKNIPLMFLYDKNGKYSTHYVGAIPEEMIDADIKKVL